MSAASVEDKLEQLTPAPDVNSKVVHAREVATAARNLEYWELGRVALDFLFICALLPYIYFSWSSIDSYARSKYSLVVVCYQIVVRLVQAHEKKLAVDFADKLAAGPAVTWEEKKDTLFDRVFHTMTVEGIEICQRGMTAGRLIESASRRT